MTEQITLTVTGMTCGGCEHAITRAVTSLEGVANVVASHRENRVTVSYDPGKVDRARIAKQIEKAGYTVAA